MATKKKIDGRKANVGAPDRGLTQDSVLVRGPAELIAAMREHSSKTGIPASTLWRKAAEAFLKGLK